MPIEKLSLSSHWVQIVPPTTRQISAIFAKPVPHPKKHVATQSGYFIRACSPSVTCQNLGSLSHKKSLYGFWWYAWGSPLTQSLIFQLGFNKYFKVQFNSAPNINHAWRLIGINLRHVWYLFSTLKSGINYQDYDKHLCNLDIFI